MSFFSVGTVTNESLGALKQTLKDHEVTILNLQIAVNDMTEELVAALLVNIKSTQALEKKKKRIKKSEI